MREREIRMKEKESKRESKTETERGKSTERIKLNIRP